MHVGRHGTDTYGVFKSYTCSIYVSVNTQNPAYFTRLLYQARLTFTTTLFLCTCFLCCRSPALFAGLPYLSRSTWIELGWTSPFCPATHTKEINVKLIENDALCINYFSNNFRCRLFSLSQINPIRFKVSECNTPHATCLSEAPLSCLNFIRHSFNLILSKGCQKSCASSPLTYLLSS